MYIDGFNWYYGIFKERPAWKWLNVRSFFEFLRPDDSIDCIKMFTAIVDPDKPSPRRERMLRYVAALHTLNGVKVILGKYQTRTVVCGASCGLKYDVATEKMTDVNIAVHMIADSMTESFDRLILVTGDSDLQPAVRWIRSNRKEKRLHVYVPSIAEQQSSRRLDFYGRIGVPCGFLPLDGIERHLLPNTIMNADGIALERPESWK